MPKTHQGSLRADGKRFAVVASRFNDFVVDKLLAGAMDALTRAGAKDDDIEVFRCPGAFEIPAVVRWVVDAGTFDGVVCLGVVIRGATPHFDMVVGEATRGTGQIGLEGKVGIGNGILACDTIEQAIERAGPKVGNRGFDAAMVAVEMTNLRASLVRGEKRNLSSP